ncbi:Putative phosphoserine phosphatase, HAD superfamily [Septoria linicola]|uniref:phosphoserine phosphatase n=1 Tax=Septoria linicola TaxID=215465 RepID=A0A9Q9ATV4_9PEZI|nr:Putative phosphoserine phosphatase, HAD superfamily [Septoria linicola]
MPSAALRHDLYGQVRDWEQNLYDAVGWTDNSMGEATAHSELVALIFAKDDLQPAEWQELFGSITDSYKRHSKDLDGVAIAHVCFLDQIPTSAASGRVGELRISATKPPTLRECKTFTDSQNLQALQKQHHVEILLQPGSLYAAHRTPGLAVFDMDSTLIQQEVIDELARAVGLYDQVAAITEAAMRGEEPYTDFEASLRARVGLLKGVPTTIWEQLKDGPITFTPGASELLRVLSKLGWKGAVLSGGFTPLAEWVKETLGLRYAYANHLVTDPALDQLTGELVDGKPIIHGLKKRELLLQIAKENGLEPENVIAVGDGSNDLPMMEVAGLGIAFNAKPKVQDAAPSKLNSKTLLDVLYILGYTKEEIDAALAAPS